MLQLYILRCKNKAVEMFQILNIRFKRKLKCNNAENKLNERSTIYKVLNKEAEDKHEFIKGYASIHT